MSAASGCFNPTYIGTEVPRDNHAPLVEVFPPPSNVPIAANLGGCGDEELSIVSLDDADGDRLTVRFDILRTVNGVQRPTLLQVSPPIAPVDGVGYPLTDNTSLVLSDERLGGLTIEDDLQLIEMRVSDNGFEADAAGHPVAGDGGAIFYMSWIVHIAECPVGTP